MAIGYKLYMSLFATGITGSYLLLACVYTYVAIGYRSRRLPLATVHRGGH